MKKTKKTVQTEQGGQNAPGRSLSRRLRSVLLTAAGLLALAAAVYAVTGYGTEDDPLITKSYLDQVVQPQLERELEEELASALSAAADGGVFTLVTLEAGQTLSAPAGTELLLRSGEAGASSPDSALRVLADATSGSSLDSGDALTADHLYVVAADGAGIAARGAVRILVSGDCSVS
ncbi:MAG: hypothetical protein IJU29_02440 [Oscillospiraceae bacterium]|nr:hypothetical protein [Oscillospiraceae bacterium]